MIPTIRSIIVATLLTVTVLAGGFGLFAAFRVNHEPLARLPVASTQFQLAAVDSAPRALNFAADQPRLETNDALRAVATAVSDHDPAQSEAAAPPAAASATVASTASATDGAVPERVTAASAPDVAPAEPSDHPASPPAPAEALAAAPPPEVAPAPEAASHEPAPPSEAASQQRTEVAAVPAAEKEPAQQDDIVTSAAETPAVAAVSPPETTPPAAVVAVTGSITEMPPREEAAPKVTKQIAPKQPQETARQIANRKRLAAVRRVRKARIAPRAQPTNAFGGFGQQADFQSTSGFQSAQSDIGGGFGAPSKAARRQHARTQQQ